MRYLPTKKFSFLKTFYLFKEVLWFSTRRKSKTYGLEFTSDILKVIIIIAIIFLLKGVFDFSIITTEYKYVPKVVRDKVKDLRSCRYLKPHELVFVLNHFKYFDGSFLDFLRSIETFENLRISPFTTLKVELKAIRYLKELVFEFYNNLFYRSLLSNDFFTQYRVNEFLDKYFNRYFDTWNPPRMYKEFSKGNFFYLLFRFPEALSIAMKLVFFKFSATTEATVRFRYTLFMIVYHVMFATCIAYLYLMIHEDLTNIESVAVISKTYVIKDSSGHETRFSPSSHFIREKNAKIKAYVDHEYDLEKEAKRRADPSFNPSPEETEKRHKELSDKVPYDVQKKIESKVNKDVDRELKSKLEKARKDRSQIKVLYGIPEVTQAKLSPNRPLPVLIFDLLQDLNPLIFIHGPLVSLVYTFLVYLKSVPLSSLSLGTVILAVVLFVQTIVFMVFYILAMTGLYTGSYFFMIYNYMYLVNLLNVEKRAKNMFIDLSTKEKYMDTLRYLTINTMTGDSKYLREVDKLLKTRKRDLEGCTLISDPKKDRAEYVYVKVFLMGVFNLVYINNILPEALKNLADLYYDISLSYASNVIWYSKGYHPLEFKIGFLSTHVLLSTIKRLPYYLLLSISLGTVLSPGYYILCPFFLTASVLFFDELSLAEFPLKKKENISTYYSVFFGGYLLGIPLLNELLFALENLNDVPILVTSFTLVTGYPLFEIPSSILYERAAFIIERTIKYVFDTVLFNLLPTTESYGELMFLL